MVEEDNFSKACAEVLEILKNVEKEDYEKISAEFLENIENNVDKNYKSNIDIRKNFEEQDLLPETIDLLACIYRQFWCNEEERKFFDKVVNENEIKYQKELSEKYSIDKIFENNNISNKVNENRFLIVQDENQNVLKRILNFIKKIINKSY